MGLRDILNNNSPLVTIIAVVVLVIALGIIVMTNKGSGQRGPRAMYYYDMNNGTIFVVDDHMTLPPIDTESGPTTLGEKAGVKTFIYSCGECEKYKGMTLAEVEAAGGFIARLEKYTPETIEAIEKARSGEGGPGLRPMMMGPGMMMGGMLVKLPGDEQWIDSNSQAGYAIVMGALENRCPGGKTKLCLPGS